MRARLHGRRGGQVSRSWRMRCGCRQHRRYCCGCWGRRRMISTRTTVALVVQLVAGAAQNHQVAGELCPQALIRAMVHIEVLSVGSVQRACVAGAQQRGIAGLVPLGRFQVIRIWHRTQLGQALRGNRVGEPLRAKRHLGRGRSLGDPSARQPPCAPLRAFEQTFALQVGGHPRQLVIDRVSVLAVCTLRRRCSQLAQVKATVGSRPLLDLRPLSFPSECLQSVDGCCSSLLPERSALARVQGFSHFALLGHPVPDLEFWDVAGQWDYAQDRELSRSRHWAELRLHQPVCNQDYAARPYGCHLLAPVGNPYGWRWGYPRWPQ